MKLRLQFAQTYKKIGKTLPGLMSLSFYCNIHMVGAEFGVNNMTAWIILPRISGSGHWWCNGVGHVFLPLSIN